MAEASDGDRADTAPGRSLNDGQFDALVRVGREVLSAFPDLPGACLMMSALYVGRLRHEGHRSAMLIGGALLIEGGTVFGRETFDGDHVRTNLDWDGHAWVRFGEYIADASLLRTGRSGRAPRRLREAVAAGYGPRQALLIATPEALLRDDRLEYRPQHVFPDEQVAALYGGALTFLTSRS